MRKTSKKQKKTATLTPQNFFKNTVTVRQVCLSVARKICEEKISQTIFPERQNKLKANKDY